jgi:hypothetical protein
MTQRDGGLRTTFQKYLPDAHWQSIETYGVGTGVPDCEFCFPGGYQGWVEFKVARLSATTLTPQQAAWIDRRVRVGGRVFIAVRKKRERLFQKNLHCDDLHLFHGPRSAIFCVKLRFRLKS